MTKKNENLVFTIIGSGFGLYGYLPAIINALKCKVVLLERYRKVIETRPEIYCYLKYIDWRLTESEVANSANSFIISVPPAAQMEIVQKMISFHKVKKLIIEKPICPSPKESIDLVNFINSKSISYRVGYSFLFTDWYIKLKLAIQKPVKKIKIYWSFKAHHFLNNKHVWKRYHSKGGGALRFYGIHIISTLASFGYVSVARQCLLSKQSDQPEEWKAEFYGADLPSCEVHVSTNSDSENFQIQVIKDSGSKEKIITSNSPFKSNKASKFQDDRVPVLESLIKTLGYDDEIYTEMYYSINNLWSTTEQQLNLKFRN